MQAKVSEGSPEGKSETMGVGFVKQVGLKPEWKRQGVMDQKSGETEEEEVTGEGSESEVEELVPEWGWRRDKGRKSDE